MGRIDALSIGDVSARTGVSVSALHFYERQGLLQSTRNAGNQRRYPRDVLRRLAIVRVAQRAGIPLAEIRATFDSLPQGRTPTRADWVRLSSRWRAALQARIDQLGRLRDQLDNCIGCGCLSLAQCPLRNPDDAAAERGPGASFLE
ncbi:redox-sensitive transcriptional activator SoxR [Luteimonas deserti]|uniref:Redox-sensitive transcriptional activator SoxR n=1 Tax=Luteimonas deserti TaxID=2752306 RepID=A0A7Z0QS27_9GAMM|nr:redox-sensitive transcriptional activator SoxR [Luteimonas deserti]NYZ62745.1 redox-sensitive transcriptional activator SoxR [Luteimonas deserti]